MFVHFQNPAYPASLIHPPMVPMAISPLEYPSLALPGSDSHQAYDLHTRALTYILSAFEATNRDSTTTLKPNPVLMKAEADL